MKYKLKLKNWIIWLLIVACLVGIIYSGVNIFLWKFSVTKNKEIKKETDSFVKEVNETEEEEKEYVVDFEKAKQINSDVVAYLKVNNTNINYFVVKGSNNSYYLNHNFRREYNIAGWIFADFKNKFDGTDKNIVIYGHNMKDGSMFEAIKNYLDSSFISDVSNREIVLMTDKENIKYQIFSSYMIEPEDYYINTFFDNEDSFKEFVLTILNRSIFDYNVEVNAKDEILTLSTCSDNGSKRIVVHAKKMADD